LTTLLRAHTLTLTLNTKKQVSVPGAGGACASARDFGFHACLGPETSQGELMSLCGVPQLLDAALAGYHVTICAYGQTG
jgi:hypothetical protein